MIDTDSSIEILEEQAFLLTDEDIQDYLTIAFSNGFSKGTANVSPHDMKKLKGLLRYYAKKPHPFRACVKDNRKRFGPLTEKYCAVLKDLIYHSTKWRGKGKNVPAPTNLSDFIADNEEFVIHYEDYPVNTFNEFFEYLADITEEDVNILLSELDDSNDKEDMFGKKEDVVDLAAGDVVWNPEKGENYLRDELSQALNENAPSDPYGGAARYWVVDTNEYDNTALVCMGGSDYFVVPYSVDKKSGDVSLAAESDWKHVESAWVESNLNMAELNDEVVTELYFTDSNTKVDKDGLIWKTFLREGVWQYSPGNKGKAPRPLTITKSGKSDPHKLVISMTELKKNFDAGTLQHVTVPLSHDDKVEENTGFVKKLRFGKDADGKAILEAAIDFTEPDIKEKIERGTIPNVSGGIHMNYIDKEKGRKFNSVLGHIALTSKPWLQGMAPFGVKASENLNVLGFSEEPESSDNIDEGSVEETMSTHETENADTFLSELGLSEDEVKARLARFAELEAEAKRNKVEESVRKWEDEKKSPAMIKTAKAILMADEGDSFNIALSEGQDESLTLSEIANRLMEAAPSVNLADDPLTEEEQLGARSPDDAEEENLSDEEKAEAMRLFLYDKFSAEEAVVEAKKRLANKATE